MRAPVDIYYCTLLSNKNNGQVPVAFSTRININASNTFTLAYDW